MEQSLEWLGVRMVIGDERDGLRRWTIYPDDGPPEGAATGIARADGVRGSFKEAVFSSRAAIEAWRVAAPDRAPGG